MEREMNKRGQFYIAAAVVIIVIIVGFAGVSNYLQRAEPVRIYDLKEELGIESGKVLEYGVYTDKGDNLDRLTSFGEAYANYMEEGFNLYFIFGNEKDIRVAGYRDLTAGTISIKSGDSAPISLDIPSKIYTPMIGSLKANNIIVTIEGVNYEFKLKPGENFYFVIYQKAEGGTFVEQG